jgi:hypothetical protein
MGEFFEFLVLIICIIVCTPMGWIGMFLVWLLFFEY